MQWKPEEFQGEVRQLRQILEHTTAGLLDPTLEARWARQPREKPALDRLLRVHPAAYSRPGCLHLRWQAMWLRIA